MTPTKERLDTEPTRAIIRHVDKGETRISEIFKSTRLTEEEQNLVQTVLGEEEFVTMSNEGKIPLTLDGVIRALRLADHIFNDILLGGDTTRNHQILVFTNSEKNRTQLTRALVAARIAQLESNYNDAITKDGERPTRDRLKARKDGAEHLLEQRLETQEQETKKLRFDAIAPDEFMKLLEPIDEPTWGPYQKMMKTEGISEDEALLRWVQDMNIPWHQGNAADKNMTQPPEAPLHPKLGAEGYREAIRILVQTIQSKNPGVPVHFFLFGHSDPLAQILYDTHIKLNHENMPQFGQMFRFDDQGNFTGDKTTIGLDSKMHDT